MYNPMETAALDAAHDGAPPLTFVVGKDAVIYYGTGRNPLHEMVITAWR